MAQWTVNKDLELELEVTRQQTSHYYRSILLDN